MDALVRKDFDIRTGTVLHMRRVILESPYSGRTDEEVVRNVGYARRCVRDCLQRGESPIASHLLFTQPGILDDRVPEERALGMQAGLEWVPLAEACVVYNDYGISAGMEIGIARAKQYGIPVEKRQLD